MTAQKTVQRHKLNQCLIVMPILGELTNITMWQPASDVQLNSSSLD